MRILFTGASSFTGYWFVKALSAAGHELVCPLQGRLELYEGVRRRRVEQLGPVCRLVPGAPFDSEAFFELMQGAKPWDLLCHHAADVRDYKSPEFDSLRALGSNTLNLRRVLAVARDAGLKGVVLTGSVFEEDEGLGEEPLRAFSPYGLSKGLTFQVFRYYCGEAGLPLGKFVIPNPFGPFEEPRFTGYLVRCWKEGKPAGVKTPDYVRDNIHVDLLAAAYAQFATRLAAASSQSLQIHPSGYIESQGAFAHRVARELRARLGWACELELARQQDFSEPLFRVNRDAAAPTCPDWNERAAWDAFAEFYTSTG